MKIETRSKLKSIAWRSSIVVVILDLFFTFSSYHGGMSNTAFNVLTIDWLKDSISFVGFWIVLLTILPKGERQ